MNEDLVLARYVQAENDQPIEDPAYIRRLMGDLWRVGPDKPMGYLPLETIRRCGFEVESVAKTLKERSLIVYKLDEDECTIGSGALFAADKAALQQLLTKHEDVLCRGRWPITARAFVLATATVFADERTLPEVHRIVGQAFGDRRFR